MGIMKYFSTALAIALMIWTWGFTQNDRVLGLEERREIVTSLEDTIVQYIKSHRPGVSDVIFQQLFTEDLPSHDPKTQEMLVRFRYLINEPVEGGEMTEQVFDGSVRLRSPDGLTWEWVDNQVKSPLIRYSKGTEIRAGEALEPSN